jgi:hypothetical protein
MVKNAVENLLKYIFHLFRRKIAFLYLNVYFKQLFTKNRSDPIFSGTLPIRSNFFGDPTDPIHFFWRVHRSDPFFSASPSSRSKIFFECAYLWSEPWGKSNRISEKQLLDFKLSDLITATKITFKKTNCHL